MIRRIREAAVILAVMTLSIVASLAAFRSVQVLERALRFEHAMNVSLHEASKKDRDDMRRLIQENRALSKENRGER